ncbi:MAG: helix-turn-helix transcriptional regulator [Bacteroidales bacterium]|nr:helix-turn-helix transcriptional regulator [Bacteroidales bacterium]
MISKNSVFAPQTKVADMLDCNNYLIDVLSRLGIRLGFGESTIEEASIRSGLDPATVCLICNVYTFDDYAPDAETLSKGRITDVVKYIRNSHRNYLTRELAWLQDALCQLILSFSEKQQKVIWRFFNEYKAELEKHFAYEEDKVLPYIQDLLFGRDTHGFTISEFAQNHSNIEEKLSDLKNLVMKTLPDSGDPALREHILRFLFYLQNDLARHTFVEDRILTPMAWYIEHPQAIRSSEKKEAPVREELSDREKEILVSVAKGMLNKEIADQYNISIHTVISHRKNITRKTGIKTVAGLTVYALLNDLIDINTVE